MIIGEALAEVNHKITNEIVRVSSCDFVDPIYAVKDRIHEFTRNLTNKTTRDF